MMRRIFLAGASLALGLGLASSPRGIAQDYQVGVSRVDVTPAYPVRLNGFGSRREETSEVSQPLWTKALAISRGAEPPVVLLALDNLGIREPQVDEVAAALAERFGLPRENLALTFTHTHCAPKVHGASNTIFSTAIPPEHQAHIDQYTRELTAALIRVAADAIENRRPAQLEWGVGRVGFAANRRTPGGPVDHDLQTLVVRDPDGGIRAVWGTYACHCVTLSFNRMSGDWAGYAQAHLERQFPGCVAMISIGCGSDSNPDPRGDGQDLELVSRQGLEIAREVERLLGTSLRPVRGAITARRSHLELPLEVPPTRAQLEALRGAGGPAGFNAESQLARLDRGEELLRAIHYPIQTITFGDDLHGVFLAGEVCVDYALALKRQLDSRRLWLHGYSNDFCSYIPSERLVREGGYGGGGEVVYFDLPTTLKPGLEAMILQEVVRQTPEGFRVPPGTQGVPPLSPTDSQAQIQVAPRFQVELVACEPLIADPVAIDFGPDGRLWVAEMPDYSRGVQEEFAPQGVIRVLADQDGDGRFDTATDFLDGLRFPTDVKVWRDGILVCDAPDILFAADRDGDGRAEIREVVVHGFATHNPHARVNSLRPGLDGWLYGSGGLFGGELSWRGQPVVAAQNRDFRLDWERGCVEPVTGATQQGRTRDDWDNWFGCTNSHLLQHYPVVERYARRNPDLAPPATTVQVPSAAHGQQLFPPAELVLFKLSGAPGRPTSACGAEIYRDRWLGAGLEGDAFVCEPVHQMIHRLKLRRAGGTFVGDRAPEESEHEFLISTDRWFRPVQVRTGPDGGLWVVDMYRYVIEHPQWIPPETVAELNLLAGSGMGRIYRVIPRGQPARRLPQLDGLSNIALARLLDGTNGTLRDMVQERLTARQARDTAPELRRIIREGVTPAAQVQAAAALAQLGLLQLDDLRTFWQHPQPEVRRLTVRLAESLAVDEARAWESIAALATDPDVAVQIQVASSLGNAHLAQAGAALGTMAAAAAEDPYLHHAILSSIEAGNALAIWTTFRSAVAPGSVPQREFADELLRVVATRCPQDDLVRLVASVESADAHDSAKWQDLTTVVEAIESRDPPVAETLLAAGSERWQSAFAAARALLDRNQATDAERIAALRLLGRRPHTPLQRLAMGEAEELPARMAARLTPQTAPEVQQAALAALVAWRPPQLVALLTTDWNQRTPRLKQQVVNALLAELDLTRGLLEQAATQGVTAGDFDSSQRQRLLEQADPAVRDAAQRLFGLGQAPSELVEKFRPALERGGDPTRGRAVFAKACAGCHVLDGAGTEVGPDLAALTNRTPAALLVAVLDPNREVDTRYLGYTATLADGKTASGLLVDETASSVTLREQGGKEHVLLRRDLDELRSTGKSAMPEGLERDLSLDAVADLLAYLVPPRTPPKAFAGNSPAVCRPAEDGSWRLPATQAEIYGEAIVFESGSPFENIGYWHGASDYAAWKLAVPTAGRYQIFLDYACAADAAGNRFRLDGVEPPLERIVPSTGSWANYQQWLVGEAELAAGSQTLVVRFAAPPQGGALMDLRALRLQPVR